MQRCIDELRESTLDNFFQRVILSDRRIWFSSLNILLYVRCLNLPVTGHSFEDAVLMSKAVELGLPPSTGVIEFCNTAGKLGYVLNKVFNNSLVYNNVGCNERSS